MIVNSQELKTEHNIIERELIELETIIHSSIINYPNLIHVLKKLKGLWEKHEAKENPFFGDLHNKGFTIPIKKISFEHGKLKRDLDRIISAIQAGKENKLHDTLYSHGIALIADIRQHMTDADWILLALPKRLRESQT